MRPLDFTCIQQSTYGRESHVFRTVELVSKHILRSVEAPSFIDSIVLAIPPGFASNEFSTTHKLWSVYLIRDSQGAYSCPLAGALPGAACGPPKAMRAALMRSTGLFWASCRAARAAASWTTAS